VATKKSSTKRSRTTTRPAKRAKRGTAAKRRIAARRIAAKRRTSPRRRTAAKGVRVTGLMQPVHPDAVLGAVVGNKDMPRPEITKRIWSYIHKHDLQDPKDRRMLIADAKLRPLFGGKRRVSMLELARLVSEHVEAA
jgi:chromatin remodeling complex protein RSC6